jgi:hypothetical protein
MSKRAGVFFLMLFSLSGALHAGRPEENRIKVPFRDRREAAALEKLGLKGEFHTGGRVGGFAVLYATPTEMDKVAALGLTYTVESLRNHAATATSLQAVIAEMDRLVKAYPRICSKHVYGKTKSGIELFALKISDNVAENENEPECLFDAGIHGNEYVGTDLLLRFADDLLSGYASDGAIANLIDNREIWLFCMVNPEGRGKTRENAGGIDLNRDWGYMAENGFSQPETRAVRDCLLENHFATHVSYHSGLEYLLYPWCYSAGASPDKAAHVFLADLYSDASGYYPKSANVQSYLDYPTSGETIDYSYGTQGTAAVTMEITDEQGGGLTDKYYAANRPAMLKAIENAGNGIRGTITDAATGKGVAAVIHANQSFPCYADPQLGDYQKFVPPGSYSLTVTANGYLPQTLADIMVKSGTATVTDIRLQPDAAAAGAFAHKVVFAMEGKGVTPDVLGKPDNRTYAGTVVVDMLVAVPDGAGSDLRIHAQATGKEYACLAATDIDGPWKSLGKASATATFDLAAAGLKSARYIRVEGASLDAVEAMGRVTTSLYPQSTQPAGSMLEVSDAADRIRSGILLDAASGVALIVGPGKNRVTRSIMDIRGKRLKNGG